MPLLTRYFIKTGLVYLVIALLINTGLAAQSLLNFPPIINALYPVYLHFLIVGWLTQLIMGVIYWMFPKFSREKPRGNDKLGWATYITLNIGLILRAVGEPLLVLAPEMNIGWLLAVSAILQLFAAYGFIVNTWGRVKER